MTASPFAKPASTSGIDWADLKGSLLLIEPSSFEQDVKTVNGPKDAVRATVHVLDGKDKGQTIEDALIFPKVMSGQLRSRLGQKVLGRLDQGVAQSGQKPPWILTEATEDDVKVGTDYLAGGISKPATTEPPF